LLNRRGRAEKQLIEGDMGACLSNPYQPLDMILLELVEPLGSYDFHHGEYVAEAPTGARQRDSWLPRDPPSNVARPVRFHCNDDIGSHVYSDGQRFLMLKSVDQGQAALTQINVVLNWFEELRQKVPAGKK
jgi:hypothetical protein